MNTRQSQQQLLDHLENRLNTVIENDALNLPPAPNLLTKISTLHNTDNHLRHIVDILADYPGICQRILTMANSPSLGARVEIKTIPLAVMRLGLSNLQVLASSAVISDYLENLKLHDLLPYFRRVWQRSIKVASISYVIALYHNDREAEKALLAGLIHNIGVMPLIKYIVDIPELQAHLLLMSTFADQVIAQHYTTIGERLLTDWQVAPELSRIARHHQEDTIDTTSADPTLDDIVFIAFHLSHLVDYCDPETPPDHLTQSAAFAKIWPDWDSATADLLTYTDKIKQIQKDIAKG